VTEQQGRELQQQINALDYFEITTYEVEVLDLLATEVPLYGTPYSYFLSLGCPAVADEPFPSSHRWCGWLSENQNQIGGRRRRRKRGASCPASICMKRRKGRKKDPNHSPASSPEPLLSYLPIGWFVRINALNLLQKPKKERKTRV